MIWAHPILAIAMVTQGGHCMTERAPDSFFPPDPAPIGVFPIMLTTAVALMFFVGFQMYDRKSLCHAWTLTVPASILMSLVGLCNLPSLISQGPVGFVTSSMQEESAVCRLAAQCFVGYIIADLLLMAASEVKSALQLPGFHTEHDIGWRHHIFYGLMLCWCLRWRLEGFFAVGLLEELPTVMLSWQRLHHAKTINIEFVVLYFALRIIFHTFITYNILQVSALFFIIGCGLLRLHLQWFGSLWKRHVQEKATDRFMTRLEVKLGLLAVLVLTHMCSHMYMLWQLVKTENVAPHMTAITQMFVFIVHGLILLDTSRILFGILSDTYLENTIMSSIDTKTIIYNISWEDPAVEIKHVGFSDKEIILTISSAGCNVLDYLCENPAFIMATDLNVAQLAVLDLKLASIAAGMSHEDFFALWGRSNVNVFQQYYEPELRKLLRMDESRAFWDANGVNLFSANFMYVGTSGLMAYLFSLIASLAGIGLYVGRHVQPTAEKKRALGFITRIFSVKWLWQAAAPLGGVPSAQMNLINDEIETFVETVVDILTVKAYQKGNYFYYGYTVGHFAQDCCPRYMSAEYYPQLKERVGKVQLFHGTLCQAVMQRQDWTFVSILDSMDWMAPDMVADQVQTLCKNTGKGCRLFWRSFCSRVHSPALAQLCPERIMEPDRVGWYLSQWIATVPPSFEADMLSFDPPIRYTNTFVQDLCVVKELVLQGLRKKKDVEVFYSNQGALYDGFRESLLPLRELFMTMSVPWAHPIRSWISVGCGTARDVEFVLRQVRHWQTKVWLLDLSPALLKMAQTRIHRFALEQYVTIIAGNFLEEEVRRQLPETVDLVTCSYCLTMIPPWEDALQGMKRLLRPGGYLGLVDFTIAPTEDWYQRLCRWWFAHDGVYMNRSHVDWLHKNLKKFWFHEEAFLVPYNVLRPRSYIFIGTCE